jgi:hypothetical protein
MTLTEFKTLHNIQSIKLYPSNTEGSKRLVGSAIINGSEQMIMTAESFVATSKEKYIYSLEQANRDGVAVTNHYISSKEPKEAALVL